jgi:hypothetical protein
MKFFCSPCKHLLVFLAADSRSTTELEADFLHSQDTRFLYVVLSSTSKLTCFLTVERSGRRRWPLTISSPGAKDSDTSNIASNSKSQDYRKNSNRQRTENTEALKMVGFTNPTSSRVGNYTSHCIVNTG